MPLPTIVCGYDSVVLPIMPVIVSVSVD